jgi:class 3 adenylate cyclase
VSGPPTTRYAANGDIHIAYQTIGDGPIDLVFVAGAFTNLDVLWENPDYTRFCERLASFTRLILFDKRGMGLSDRVRIGTLEERMDDVRAVMDAAGSESAVLLGVSEGGPMSMLFAATHPERTRALILAGAEVKEETTEDWPWGESTPEEFEAAVNLERVVDRWGKGLALAYFMPSRAGDEELQKWFGRLQTHSASPHDAVAIMQMAFAIDVRHVAPTINVPTLVVHRTGDGVCSVENGRWLARTIPNARYVELPGADHILFVNGDDILAEIQEFLTGTREPIDPDRVLATVMFTDIVGSTERAGEMGDSRWRELLESHNALVCEQVERFDGRPVKSTGDGFLATFDGPAKAIRCASTITAEVRRLGIEVRAGIHTGECERMNGDVGGLAVHIGARVGSLAPPGHVVVSSTVRDLVAGSGIDFVERGTEVLKGVPGEWRLYSVAGPASSVASAKPIADTRCDRASDRVGVAMARRAPWIGRSIARAFMPSARKRG